MFIQTQQTPNPSSLMFIPGEKVLEGGSKSFTSAREAMASPLAKKLFNIDGVTQVGRRGHGHGHGLPARGCAGGRVAHAGSRMEGL